MSGEFQTKYVYPEVLLATDTQQLRLAEAEEWSFGGQEIESKNGFRYPLLSAALFGRLYANDSNPAHAAAEVVVNDDAVGAAATMFRWMVTVACLVISLLCL